MSTLAQLAIEKLPLEQVIELLQEPLPPATIAALKKRITIDSLWQAELLEDPSLLQYVFERINPRILWPYLANRDSVLIITGYSGNPFEDRGLTEKDLENAIRQFGQDIHTFLESPGALYTLSPSADHSITWDYHRETFRLFIGVTDFEPYETADELIERIVGYMNYFAVMRYSKLTANIVPPESLTGAIRSSLRAIGKANKAQPSIIWDDLREGAITTIGPFELSIKYLMGDYSVLRVVGNFLYIRYTGQKMHVSTIVHYERKDGLLILNSLFLEENQGEYHPNYEEGVDLQ